MRDLGKGISKEALAHLFDGGFSGQTNTEPDYKRSMGIGLSVCMSIIKIHGGKMTAENKPEGGAEFCFTPPCKEEL